METVNLIGTILGGLGLFLLAIGMMTDGLKMAAGSALRTLLSKWSKTPLRGIFSGFFMTAVVQSSSAVTVASLGFVNAGLISMRQALGIIYGSNVGTTMTGWLVAIVGFKFNIQAFALPMIGLGMLIKLIRPKDKIASFGLALVGFGLFFVGIDILKGAFEGIVLAFDISKFTADGVTGVLIFLLVGIVMTVLTQSSSASIALTITAASSGMVGVYAAGAMVIGANIGTTSTAMLASIGATSNAKRVAAAQVIFNVATALVALAILPILFYFIATFTKLLNITADPAISLAIFHTVFNVLGVLLVYPLNDRLAKFLDGRFRSWEEQEARPRFLDKTIAQTPALAVNALLLELLSMADKVLGVLSKTSPKNVIPLQELDHKVSVVKSLSKEVSGFIVTVESSAMSQEITEDLATLLRVDQYFLTVVASLEYLAKIMNEREALEDEHFEAVFVQLFEQSEDLMVSISTQTLNSEQMSDKLNSLISKHDEIKAALIIEATQSHISVTQMSQTLDCMAEIIRVAQQWSKAFTRIRVLESAIKSQNFEKQAE